MSLVAHGIGGRADLPLPLWLFAYGAGFAVLISFVALGAFWRRARLERVEGAALPAPPRAARVVAEVAVRLVGLAAFAFVVTAGWAGDPDSLDNLAPVALYVVFWVGLQLVSALVGDIWAWLSPFDTVALVVGAASARIRGRETAAARSGDAGSAHRRPDWGHVPAAATILAFAWLELVHPDRTSPRLLAGVITAYAVVILAGAARWGRAWLRENEGFGVWFRILAHMAPVTVDPEGRLRLRPPISGLPHLAVRPGTLAAVVVALGSTSFDGLTRTRLWADIIGSRTGWEQVPVATVGLLWMIGLVALVYTGAMRIAAARTGREADELVAGFTHSLVPIALAYAVAHYYSLLVFEGQRAIRLVSDPLGRGWDLFGTAHNVINYVAVSVSHIAWVQAVAIVLGHVAAVVVAHDRAVAWFPGNDAARSQYPLVGVMVLYTVGGLARSCSAARSLLPGRPRRVRP